MSPAAQPYFTALGGGRYRPTELTQGAWQPDEQHVAPVIGLLLHALELNHPREDLQWSRISVDILGMIRRQEMTVTTRVLRPGRTIELLESTVEIGGRSTVRATAWRLVADDTSAHAAVEHEPLPDPEGLDVWEGMGQWDGRFIDTLEFRSAASRPGRAQTWVRTEHPLVDAEESSDLARWVGLLDTANGTAVRQDPRDFLFPNVDLTLHLFRRPEGPWLGLDTRVSWGPTGLGQTSSVAHDHHGPVGTVEQSLTVRPAPQRDV